MHPKADEFILDVRRAVRSELKPNVVTDSELINPASKAAVIERTLLWLTPKIAEAYDPQAFATWPEGMRAELGKAVEGFRAVAGKVPSNRPAADDQAQAGMKAFAILKETVRKVALAEWTKEAGKLVDQVEQWAGEFGWAIKRKRKILNEILLGEYELDQLYLYAEGSLFILDPFARFNPGGLGAFDLSIQPSFNATSIHRRPDGKWYVHLGFAQAVRGAKSKPLSAGALKQAVEELRLLP